MVPTVVPSGAENGAVQSASHPNESASDCTDEDGRAAKREKKSRGRKPQTRGELCAIRAAMAQIASRCTRRKEKYARRIRTPNPRFRRPMRYPIAPRARKPPVHFTVCVRPRQACIPAGFACPAQPSHPDAPRAAAVPPRSTLEPTEAACYQRHQRRAAQALPKRSAARGAGEARRVQVRARRISQGATFPREHAFRGRGGAAITMAQITLRVLDGADRGRVFDDLQHPGHHRPRGRQLAAAQRRAGQPLPRQNPGRSGQDRPHRSGEHQRHQGQRRGHPTAHPALRRHHHAGPLGAVVRLARADRRPAGRSARRTVGHDRLRRTVASGAGRLARFRAQLERRSRRPKHAAHARRRPSCPSG